MNTYCLVLAVLMLCAAVVHAQEPVAFAMSANAFGVIKRELPPGGKMITVSIPLENTTDPQNWFTNLPMASELPIGSSASFWNEQEQKWSVGAKGTKGWEANVNSIRVKTGEFFFLKGPDASKTPTIITMSGEIPSHKEQVRFFSGGNQMSALASMFPVDFWFTNSVLATRATTGSSASFWDEEKQIWVVGAKGAKGWDTNVTTQKVLAASGFFMKEMGTVTSWTNTKPYTWP